MTLDLSFNGLGATKPLQSLLEQVSCTLTRLDLSGNVALAQPLPQNRDFREPRALSLLGAAHCRFRLLDIVLRDCDFPQHFVPLFPLSVRLVIE
jgi:hypothetical protein